MVHETDVCGTMLDAVGIEAVRRVENFLVFLLMLGTGFSLRHMDY